MPITQDRMTALISSARSFLDGWDELRTEVSRAMRQGTFRPERALSELEALNHFADAFQARREALAILIAEETHFGRMSAHNDSARIWAQQHRKTHGTLPKRVYEKKAPESQAAPARVDEPGQQSAEFYARAEAHANKNMEELSQDKPKPKPAAVPLTPGATRDTYGDPEADEIEEARLRGESPV